MLNGRSNPSRLYNAEVSPSTSAHLRRLHFELQIGKYLSEFSEDESDESKARGERDHASNDSGATLNGQPTIVEILDRGIAWQMLRFVGKCRQVCQCFRKLAQKIPWV